MAGRQKKIEKQFNENASLYLIFGEDQYPANKKAREIVDRLCPVESQAFGLEIIDGSADKADEAIDALSRCSDALRTLGFMGDSKVIWLKGATFFGSSRTAQAKDVKALVEQFVKGLKSDLLQEHKLVITAPKIDKRSAFYKACDAVGNTLEFALPEQGYKADQAAQQKAREAFAEKGLSIPPQVLNMFVEKTSADTQQIVQEVEKVSLYLGDRKKVEPEDIELMVSTSKESAFWDFADAVAEQRMTDALRIFRQLRFQGIQPVGLIINLETRFKELLFYRECLEQRWLAVSGQAPWFKAAWHPSPEMVKAIEKMPTDPTKTNPFRAGRLASQARKFPKNKLIDGLAKVLKTHEQMVSSPVPAEMLMEYLLVRLFV